MTFGFVALQCRGSMRAGGLCGLLALALSGCAGMPSAPGAEAMPAGAAVPVAAAPAPAADPLAAFAATAAPGTEGQVPLPGTGRNARARLLRAYHAASGHECREVLIGSGLEERTSLVCQQDGTWAAVRPLLRGSGS